VTLNGGYRMRAWYDIVALDRRAAEDEAGIRESADGLRALIRREQGRGIPSHRIVLAGFSQGGAMALHTGLREAARLAGVVALSTYLPLARTLEAEAHPANAAVPVFMAHGTFDPIVPLPLGEGSRDRLRSRGYEVDWRSYPMAHAVCAEEVADLRQWLLRVLPPPDPAP
jgi:phospholipase/carboxylesterase